MECPHTRDELVDIGLGGGAREETLDITGGLVNLGESSVDVRDSSTGHGGDDGGHGSDSSELHCDGIWFIWEGYRKIRKGVAVKSWISEKLRERSELLRKAGWVGGRKNDWNKRLA